MNDYNKNRIEHVIYALKIDADEYVDDPNDLKAILSWAATEIEWLVDEVEALEKRVDKCRDIITANYRKELNGDGP